MKNIFYTILFSFISITLFAQGNYTERSGLDPLLEPFYHGVASGDPLADKVIIWTRVTPRSPGEVSGTWHMATDSGFTNEIKSGVFTTNEDVDYTVHIDVDGLNPDTWYYYEFNAYDKNSVTGRTKTAPAGGVEQLRLAIVSCSNYPSGYFNSYDRITERNDVSVVLHLGDYIYEYANDQFGNARDVEPPYEILNINDYRLRYSTYKLDPSTRKVHQQYPFITVWDDHETANNSWYGGAENHTPGSEGDWFVRKASGQEAYYEWLPIRRPDIVNDPTRIWRKFSYGNMADIIMLDTRLYARDEQGRSQHDYNDTTRHILGPVQMQWLKDQLLSSTAKWKIIGQQVMVAPLTPGGITLNNDQWDGYVADRKELLKFIKDNDIDNVVILTGDIHTAWAMDIPYNTNNYNPATGNGSVAVEFVTTSVTSASVPFTLPGNIYDLIHNLLPYIKYVDLTKKGYSVLDLVNEKVANNFYSVGINSINPNQNFEEGWYANDGENHLRNDNTPTTMIDAPQYQAPPLPRGLDTLTTGIAGHIIKDFAIVGTYPNPFVMSFAVQYNLFKDAPASIEMYDVTGKLLFNKSLGTISKGLHIEKITEAENLPVGIYQMLLKVGDESIQKQVVKIKL